MQGIDWLPVDGFEGGKGKYLYLCGGYHSVDKGCPEWGSNRDDDTYYIGDNAGRVLLTYRNGETDSIPLIFGYTLWFVKHFADCAAPFYGKDARSEMTRLLEDTLCLYGGAQARSPYVLCIRLDAPLCLVKIIPNPNKKGEPVFTGYHLSDELLDDFFSSHTVDARDALPLRITKALADMSRALYSFDPQDYITVPRFEIPRDHTGARVSFSGSSLADIATGVFYHNILEIRNKIEENGKVHESTYMAPSWRYDGFGTWLPEANQYYNDMWTRNQIAVSVLARLGYTEKAQKAVAYFNRCMMNLKKQELTLGGKKIPGHWTVVCDNPFFYSKVLAFAGWYTKYTRERFGDEYQNLGNFEVDGHGFAMICTYNTWNTMGRSREYVLENLEMLKEPIRFIKWCLDNPELSFSEHGLLYGETEAGLADIAYGAGMKITMYGNVACCLGVRGYACMAAEAGLDELCEQWSLLADRLDEAILNYFVKDGKWDLYNRGFYHDAVLPTLAELEGYDAAHDFNESWLKLSQDTYDEDKKDYIGKTMVGPRGVGYDHCIFTRTAMLLDKVEDYSLLIENLCKICFSPRLPKPYVVPECVSYSPEKKIFRRQGDLGNLVHQAEAMSTLMAVIGLCQNSRGEVKWLPRLPKGWKLEAEDIPVPGTSATAELECGYPEGGKQSAAISIKGDKGLPMLVRMGPFNTHDIKCSVNGELVQCESERCGTAFWCRIKLDVVPDVRYVIEAEEFRKG